MSHKTRNDNTDRKEADPGAALGLVSTSNSKPDLSTPATTATQSLSQSKWQGGHVSS